MVALDKYVFERKGARGCSNSDYRVVLLTCCDRQVVEDDELSDLYFDAADLSKTVSLLLARDEAPGPCPLCHAADWDLIPVDDPAGVSEEWRWARRRA